MIDPGRIIAGLAGAALMRATGTSTTAFAADGRRAWTTPVDEHRDEREWSNVADWPDPARIRNKTLSHVQKD